MNLNGPLVSGSRLTNFEITLLKKGGIQTVADLILTPIQDIAKRCRCSPMEIKRIVDNTLNLTPIPKLRRLDEYPIQDDAFTTGSDILDNMLGGGLRTGMVWEVVGESSAGKTQFALQESLFVQLPHSKGGLNGSACYLTTSANLPTSRLLQISTTNELLANSSCGLENIHTLKVPTVAALQQILTDAVPSFVRDQSSKVDGRPVKLLVIDALGELFHSNNRTTTSTLATRSKDLSIISTSLHHLARSHHLTVLVLNEVIDIFDRKVSVDPGEYPGLLYESHSRWFNSAEFFGDTKKEASLGLVWANQVNTRIMLSRTGRRKYVDLEGISKRTRISDSVNCPEQEEQHDQQPSLIRRLSVIFSNVCLPFCLDYVVAENGFLVLPDQDPQSVQPGKNVRIITDNPSDSIYEARSRMNASHSESGTVQSSNPAADGATAGVSSTSQTPDNEDQDHQLWSNAESYDDLDWDALEQALSQTPQNTNL